MWCEVHNQGVARVELRAVGRGGLAYSEWISLAVSKSDINLLNSMVTVSLKVK